MKSNLSDSKIWNYLDHLTVGCCVTTSDFIIIKWNRLLEYWTSFDSLSVTGKDIREIVQRFKDPLLLRRLDSVVKDGVPAIFSSQLHNPIFPCKIHGTELVHEVSVSNIKGDGDNNTLLFSVVDVTDLADKLERSRYAQRILEKQKKELEYSNRELLSFGYVVSHDLRAPLRGIANLASWIEEDTSEILPEKSKEHLNKIQSLANRMSRLMGDLLEYSKVGSVDLPLEEFDTNLVIQDVLQFLMPRSGMDICVEGKLPIIKSARAPFETVLRNIIGNSLKHHHQERGQIVIKSSSTEEGVNFSISDDGPGISSEYHDRVFQLFQTLKPRDVVEGSGIGLALVRRMLDNFGGNISLRSNIGEGTEVNFVWPCEARWTEN